MTVPLRAMNFDEEGKRISDPKLYGFFVKTKTIVPGVRGLRWQTYDMPPRMLLGMRAQLTAALELLDRQVTANI